MHHGTRTLVRSLATATILAIPLGAAPFDDAAAELEICLDTLNRTLACCEFQQDRPPVPIGPVALCQQTEQDQPRTSLLTPGEVRPPTPGGVQVPAPDAGQPPDQPTGPETGSLRPNSGAGNQGETGDGELAQTDVDPGNSGDNNNAPDNPPGQVN